MRKCMTCGEKATLKVWCPTWIDVKKGPRWVCEECAKPFMPYHRKEAANEWYFWASDADEAFANCGVILVRGEDDQYSNALGMCQNGTCVTSLANKKTTVELYVVDGKLWMITGDAVLNVGEYFDAKERYKLYGEYANKRKVQDDKNDD